MPYRASNTTTSISITTGPPGEGSLKVFTYIKPQPISSLSGVPIEGVKVEISGPGLATLYTDSTGMAFFERIALGDYVVKLSKEGYKDASSSASLSSATPDVIVEIYMEAGIGIPTWAPIVIGAVVVGLVLMLIPSGRKKQ